ncbi:hypothetical protein D3C72_377120 [compost metagenome]
MADLHAVDRIIAAETDEEVAQSPDSAQRIRRGRAAAIDLELGNIQLSRPVHVDDLELVVIGRGQLAVLHIGKVAVHAHGVRRAVVDRHMASGPRHNREGQLVETDPFAKRHDVRADVGFGDGVHAIAQVEVVGIRSTAAVQRIIALAGGDELVRPCQGDGVRPGRADDVFNTRQAMLARRPVRRAPTHDATGDLQAQARAGHGLIVTAILDPDPALLPIVPFFIAVIHPLLVGRDAGREAAGIIDRVDALTALIDVSALGRDDPVVARSGVDAVDPSVAFQLVSEARASQILYPRDLVAGRMSTKSLTPGEVDIHTGV